MFRSGFLLALLAVCGMARAESAAGVQAEARLFRDVPADRIFERRYVQQMPRPEITAVEFFERPEPLGDGLCRSVVHSVSLNRDLLGSMAERQTGVNQRVRYRMVESSADCAALKTTSDFFESPDEATASQATTLLRQAMVLVRKPGPLAFTMVCTDFSRSRPCQTVRKRVAGLRIANLTSVNREECPSWFKGPVCYRLDFVEGDDQQIEILADARGGLGWVEVHYNLPRAVI